MSGLPTAGPLLIVSPHFDDAALSCSALLERDEPVDVLTVLGGEPEPPRVGWSERHMGFPNSRETMAARRTEDGRAWAGGPHRSRWLDLLDDDYLDRPRPASDDAAVRHSVAEWCVGNPGGTVALPAGAGRRRGRARALIERMGGGRGEGVLQHSDHLFVRDAALTTVRETGAALVLYEELPYLWGGRADVEVAALSRRRRIALARTEAPVDRVRKAERIGRYASQIEQLWHTRLDDPAELPATEAYWLCSPGGASATSSSSVSEMTVSAGPRQA